MKSSIKLLASIFVVCCVGLANAQTVNQRLHNQNKRIDQGIKSGELTRGETLHLRSQDARIRSQELHDKVKNGGNLTDKEKRQFNRELNRTSTNIYRDKHNGKTRG